MTSRKLIVFITLFVLLVSACSSAAQVGQAPLPGAEMRNDQSAEGALYLSEVEQKASAPEAPMEAPVPESLDQSGNSAGLLQSDFGRMVIKDAVMDLLVQDTARALDDVTDLVATQGGYIISTSTWFDGDHMYAGLRMGVPAVNFERTLTFLRALGIQVLNETASGQDVTAEYTDLQSRLNNLEATAARVRAFLDDAKTVEESLRINSTLSDLEGQIEQIKGQMKYFEDRAAYSTIQVNLNPLIPTPTPWPTPTPVAWNPGDTVRDAAEVGVNIFQTLIDGLIWLFLGLWPLLLFIGLIIGLIVFLRNRRRSKAKKAPAVQDTPKQE